MCGGEGFSFIPQPRIGHERPTETDGRRRKEGLLQYQKSRLVYSSKQALEESLVQGTVPDLAVMQV